MSKIKYTKELLEEVVATSLSIAQVIRALGLREAGGTHSHISRKLKEYEVDTSHFLGQRANCGANHKGGKRSTPDEVLTKRMAGRRQHAHILRRALIEAGVEYKCAGCGNSGTWNNKPLMLQVEHKNKDWLDDRKDNLEFLCPNCHSQTPGWCGSKGFAEITTTAKWHRHNAKKKKGLVAE